MTGAGLTAGAPAPPAWPGPAAPPGPPAPLDPALRDRFLALVAAETGIRLAPAKLQMIEGRLRRRLTALGLPDLAAYLARVFEPGRLDEELPHVIEALTTNKTDFFREPAHFDLLRDRILPEALARPGRARFKLWSAAASTGAEAWSAAMLLAEAARRRPGFRFAVLGTDISRGVLAEARRAVYPAEVTAPVPAPLAARYLMQGRAPGPPRRRILPELRRHVQFARLNLMETPYPVDRDLDVIFLRNVLIYFDRATQGRVIAALAPHLKQGGYLIVGHSESMTVRLPGLDPVAPAVFRKGPSA